MCLLHTGDAEIWWVGLYFLFGVLITLCLQDGGAKLSISWAILTTVIWPITIMAAIIMLIRNDKQK